MSARGRRWPLAGRVLPPAATLPLVPLLALAAADHLDAPLWTTSTAPRPGASGVSSGASPPGQGVSWACWSPAEPPPPGGLPGTPWDDLSRYELTDGALPPAWSVGVRVRQSPEGARFEVTRLDAARPEVDGIRVAGAALGAWTPATRGVRYYLGPLPAPRSCHGLMREEVAPATLRSPSAPPAPPVATVSLPAATLRDPRAPWRWVVVGRQPPPRGPFPAVGGGR